MGENYSVLSTVLIAAFVFIVLLAKSLQNQRKKSYKSASKLPPGGRSWPLIGDGFKWYAAVAGSHPPSFVEDQVKRFGSIFSCNLFGKRAVVSADPTFNRFIMQNEGRLFQSCYPKAFRDLVGKDGVINVQGDQQRKLHKIATNMMRLEKLKFHFLKDIQMVMLQTLDNFHENEVILLQDVCRKVAIHLMVNQLLGVSSESEVNEMANLFSDFVDGCLSFPINLPGFTYFTAMKAREAIISKINRTIEKRRQQQVPDSGNGVLGRLLEEENLPDDAIADFIINLLFAGNETTAKTMLFAVYFLTHCPMALKELMEEQENFSNKRADQMLTWEDYKAMPFTQCVIDETLRIGGIAIWLMREAKEDVAYEDYVIPKGCFVVPFLSAVHLDENLYKGATDFNPWRWMDPENQEKRNWRSSPVFAPFGGGARFCPGAELARLQIAIFLHYFVTTYRWEQMKEDQMSFFPSARLVNGFQIRPIKRNGNKFKFVNFFFNENKQLKYHFLSTPFPYNIISN
ncbi:abietadienol/abietadienal oxidase [Magnolia sinica]|uniref:abietadienol/abietadienal oxidase n=1 Tax=Magnolia sinica TaxID=86752 RepID=UPI00265B00A6|nr:abietadienol/abietadienal oxidase [Magnolia sinica]